MKTIILLLTLTGGLIRFVPGQPATPRAADQALSIRISGPQSDVPAGAPVAVKIRVTNASNRDVNASASYDRGMDMNYEYVVRNDAGQELRPQPHGGPIIRSDIIRTLKPGESVEDVTDVGGLYDFTPGTYTIQLSRHVSGDHNDAVVKSNTITVTVVPPTFSIAVSTPKAAVKAGSVVSLNVRLTNSSTRELAFGVSPPSREVNTNYMYACYSGMGRNVAYSHPVGPGDDALITLKPGEVRDEQVAISSACNLSQPGEYRIQLFRPDPNDPKHSVKSNEITLTVRP